MSSLINHRGPVFHQLLPGLLIILFSSLLLCSTAAAQAARFLGPNPIDNDGDLFSMPVNVDGDLFTGRVSALATSPTNPDLYYAAGADGGVWRSINAGQSWQALTDDMPTLAMGSLALDPSDEQVIYAGTGEPNYANHSRYGLGIYKSTNGGDSWQQLAAEVFSGRTISSIIISHADGNTVYAGTARAGGFPELAAAKGHPQSEDPLGVYRSTDGGNTWELLPGLPNLAITDLIMHPTNADILYAAVGRIFGDDQNGIYRSTDAGNSWQRLQNGLPDNNVGRISLAISPDQPARLFALLTNASSLFGGSAFTLGVFRSDDGGESWSFIPSPISQASFGWYLSFIDVEPGNPDRIYAGGFNLIRSDDGGTSWVDITPPHVDQHALAWGADGRLLSGSDGGVFASNDLGTMWEPLNNDLGLVQFYAGLSLNPDNADILIGGTQDNGTNQRNGDAPWQHLFGGDGGWTQLDPVDPQIRYVQFQGIGNLFRINADNSIDDLDGGDTPQLFGRTAFFAPFIVDPSNRNRILYATHLIFESLDRGTSWQPISQDVTTGTGAVRSIAMAPSDSNVIYIATNDGLVQRSDDGGRNFTLIAEDIPGWPRITRELFIHPENPMIVYLAVAHFEQAQIMRSDNGGADWEALDAFLPDVPVNVVAVDTRADLLRDGVIYAGTDSGIYFSVDDGISWQQYGEGMPNAAVIDLLIDEPRGRLIAATQGRGAWELPANLPPTMSVLSIPNGSGNFTLTGSAFDPEQNDISEAINWFSDRDGPLGTGAQIEPTFSSGDHLVTATVSDENKISFGFEIPISVSGSINDLIPDGSFSGTWFNPQRSGEGFFIEIFERQNTATGTSSPAMLLAWFTYQPDNSGRTAWIGGSADITANPIVLDSNIAFGGTFGDAFDPNDINRTSWGRISVRFDDCNNATISYQGPPAWGSSQINVQRISGALLGNTGICADQQAAAGTVDGSFSGTWFNPARDGEGFFLELNQSPDNTADAQLILAWFTYRPDGSGRPAWIVGSGSTDSNGTLRVSNARIASGTGFGPRFDPDEINRTPWGEILIDFDDCSNARIRYNGPPDWGSGELQSRRLTGPLFNLDDLNCL